ncbi:MAG TPA: glycosyltransferase [bacterium]|nr:glycosyltransferase [bacterium]HPT29665.1 glycosyltransferase [bacterium]
MKIIQLNKAYWPHIGGIETIVRQMAIGLGIDVLACNEGCRRQERTDGPARVFLARSWGKIWSLPVSGDFFWWFKKLVKSYDAVFLHEPFPLGSLAVWLFARQKPLFIYYHSDIVRQKLGALILSPLVKANLRRAKMVFVSSQRMIDNSKWLLAVKDKCQVLPFGLEKSEYALSAELQKQADDLRNVHGRFALAVGRLVYYKGFSYLISAWQNVAAKLIIVGSGFLEKQLKKQARELGLAEKIVFVPWVADLRPYYLASDFLVLPSCAPSEAFGLVQLSALAYGRPVINTELNTGVSEVSLDGVSGLTVAPRDADALHRAINLLLTDDHLRERLGVGAKERFLVNYRLEQFLEKLKASLN